MPGSPAQKMLDRLVADTNVTEILEKSLVPVVQGGDAGDDRFPALICRFIDGLQQGLGGAIGQALGGGTNMRPKFLGNRARFTPSMPRRLTLARKAPLSSATPGFAVAPVESSPAIHFKSNRYFLRGTPPQGRFG